MTDYLYRIDYTTKVKYEMRISTPFLSPARSMQPCENWNNPERIHHILVISVTAMQADNFIQKN
jgi:hypothetical protein